MEQLEQLSQWISQNQHTTLIAGVGCIFGALIFLFWAAREFMSWFFRTGQILDELASVKTEVQKLSQQLKESTVPLKAEPSATENRGPLANATQPPAASVTSVPLSQFTKIIANNEALTEMTSEPKFRKSQTEKEKSLFPIRHS